MKIYSKDLFLFSLMLIPSICFWLSLDWVIADPNFFEMQNNRLAMAIITLVISLTSIGLLIYRTITKTHIDYPLPPRKYTRDEVIKAMDAAHLEGLLYGSNNKYKSPLNDYGDWIDENL